MKALICENCGGDEFSVEGRYRICKYCKSRFLIPVEEQTQPETTISLHDDVQRLLRKCKTDPARAKKYATLILELDPRNKEAISILMR